MMKVLVISPSWIGDTTLSQSLYRKLITRYPNIIIDVIAPEWCFALLSRMPEVNKAILMPINHGSLKIKKRLQLGHMLYETHYNRAYVLPNSFKSALVPFFARIPRRIGWRGEMRYGLLNDTRVISKKAHLPTVIRYVSLAYDKGTTFNVNNLPQQVLWPKFQVFCNEKLQICNEFHLSSKRQIIGFCPGSEFGPAKCWPHYHYAELAKLLINKGYQIVLFGSKKDCKISNKISSTLDINQYTWCKNLVGKTQLEKAIVLIASCRAIVTNDSGLMHVAAAVSRPLVALYGPSNPDFTPPLSNKAKIIRLITGYYKVRNGNSEQGYHQSLIDITPVRVLDVLSNLLIKYK